MKQIKMLLLSSMVIFFTACGGGGGSDPDTSDSPQTIAIDKIKAYADDNTQTIPTVEDYTDAGVVGVTLENIDDVNEVVSGLTSSDVDTPEEIQNILNDLGINILPTADAGSDQSVIEGETVTLDGSSSSDIDGMITDHEWKDGATVLSTLVSFDKSDFSVGVHTITLTVTDDDNATDTDEVNVTVTAAPVNIPPTADAGSDQSVIEGETVTLDGSSSSDIDGMITDHEWKEGATVLSTLVSFDKSDFSVGVHTITLTVTDDDNATDTDEVNVTVTAAPVNIPPTADAGSDQSVIEGETVTLDGSSSSDIDGMITDHEWKEGATVLSTLVSFDKSDFSVGVHTITLTVTDDDGATDTDEVNVTVVDAVSFVNDVMPIFVANCRNCHNTTTNDKTFKVGDAAYTYDNIIDNSLISLTLPDSSDILIKGNGGDGHGGGDRLSDVNSQIVRDWIEQGGLEN